MLTQNQQVAAVFETCWNKTATTFGVQKLRWWAETMNKSKWIEMSFQWKFEKNRNKIETWAVLQKNENKSKIKTQGFLTSYQTKDKRWDKSSWTCGNSCHAIKDEDIWKRKAESKDI